MKKKIYAWTMALLTFFAIMPLTSCSSSDDDDNTSDNSEINGGGDKSTESTAKVVKLTTSDSSGSWDDFVLTYNNNRLSQLVYGDEYNGGTYKVEYNKDGYDVVLTATQFATKNGRTKQVYQFHLNKAGYLSDGIETSQSNGEEATENKMYFSYDQDGHLTSYKTSDGENYEFTYQDGNMIKSVETYTIDQMQDQDETDIAYSSYPNSFKFMAIDNLDIADFDALEGLALAGMLGEPSKNLPSNIGGKSITWSLDKNNCPLSFKYDGATTVISWSK